MVFALTGGTRLLRASDASWAIGFGLLTETVIAAYTLWDKHAVSRLLIPRLVCDWGVGVTRVALLGVPSRGG